MPALSFCYDQSIDFVGESVAPPLFAKIGGAMRIVSGAVTGPMEALNGDGSVYKKLDMACEAPACAPNPPYRPTGDTHTLTLTGQGGFGDLLGTGTCRAARGAATGRTTATTRATPASTGSTRRRRPR